jgi:hypothetical protein
MVIDANVFPHVFLMGGAPRWAIIDESSTSTTPHDHSSRTQQITAIPPQLRGSHGLHGHG